MSKYSTITPRVRQIRIAIAIGANERRSFWRVDMTDEHKELNTFIALHVTKTLRRLTEAEYAEVVARCEDVNKDPHPNLLLTQPYRFEGSCPSYTTDPAHAMQVLKNCMEYLDKLTNRTDFEIVVFYDEGSCEPYCVSTDSVIEADEKYHARNCVSAATMELAICRFCKNLYTPKSQW